MTSPSDTSLATLIGRLAGLTRRQEDFVTECFAAVLASDPRAAHSYWRQVSRGLPRSVREASGPISIKTQHTAGTGSSRLDMLLKRSRHTIGVEHKLYAPQGENQLPKYLSLPKGDCRYIALVTAQFQAVGTDVLRSRRYARPTGSHAHFLWSDFFAILEKAEKRGSLMGSATRRFFETKALNPAHPLIGDLRLVVDGKRTHDARMRKALEPLAGRLRRSGWAYVESSTIPSRQSEFYIKYGPSKHLKQVWIDPISSPASVRIRLKTTSPAIRNRMLASLLKGATSPLWSEIAPVRLATSTQGQHWAIELRIPWLRLLRRATKQSQVSERVSRAVITLMRKCDPDAV